MTLNQSFMSFLSVHLSLRNQSCTDPKFAGSNTVTTSARRNNKPNFDKFKLPTKFGFIRNWKNVHLKVEFIKPNKY